MIKGVIFDLDGVLLSTDELHYEAWKFIADKEGIPFDREVNSKLKGVSRMDSLEIILGNAARSYTQEEKNTLAEIKNDRYRESLADLSPKVVDIGVRETLSALKARGMKLAVGSSSKNTKLIIARTDLAGYFDAVSDGTNITRSKPDPEVFLKAAEFIGLAVEECAVVEDAMSGIDAACAGGFLSIGISEAAEYTKTDIPITCLSDILRKI